MAVASAVPAARISCSVVYLVPVLTGYLFTAAALPAVGLWLLPLLCLLQEPTATQDQEAN